MTGKTEKLVSSKPELAKIAFDEAFTLHHQTVFRAVRSVLYRDGLTDIGLAEDVTQEVFLLLYSNWDAIENSEMMRPWLIRVALNKARKFLRNNRRNLYIEDFRENLLADNARENLLVDDFRESLTFDNIRENIFEENYVETSELIALTLIEKEIKVVSLSKDGRFRFLDESKDLHNIIYPSFVEELSLQNAIEEFEDLINSRDTSEREIQDFFELNPDFILNDDYKKAHSHIFLSKENKEILIPDFILEPVDQSSFCDLLELKLPTAEIFVLKKNRERYSAAVFEAAAQLREYGKYFDNEMNRSSFQQKYPCLKIYKPRMFVIIGRQNNESSMLKREIQSEFPQLFLRTYDELLARMKWKKEKLENKNRLF